MLIPSAAAAAEGTFMGGLTEVDYPRTDENPTFVATTGGAANTKGNYAELIASTAGAATMAKVTINSTNQTGIQVNLLVDIATGAAASETVIIPNIVAGSHAEFAALGSHGPEFWFPVDIPAGTRVSARCQDSVGADTANVHVALYGGGLAGGGIDTMGVTTATSLGTTVTGGNNAYGTWTEIEDSTTAAYKTVIPSLATAEATWLGSTCLIQVGTGAALSETALQTFECTLTTAEAIRSGVFQPIVSYTAIPLGTRVAVRIWGGGAAEVFQVGLHGVK
jgi:hypothetical protein